MARSVRKVYLVTPLIKQLSKLYLHADVIKFWTITNKSDDINTEWYIHWLL